MAPALVLGLALGVGAWPGLAAARADGIPSSDWPPGETAPPAAAQAADWVIASRDNRGLPFAIVDKALAEVWVFSPEGVFIGAGPALLGSARGDDSAPGVGDRALADIRPEERTTPAGRFIAAYGPATGGKSVLWVDYETAISLHPVIDTNKREQRPKRLRSASTDDNRITYGCINVDGEFYREVVRPAFSRTDGVFYILPETRSLAEVLPAFAEYLHDTRTPEGSGHRRRGLAAR